MTATVERQKRAGSPWTLPTPADRPGADILIFDGHCRMCRAQVERLHRWDSRDSLAFLSLHDQQVPEPFPDLS